MHDQRTFLPSQSDATVLNHQSRQNLRMEDRISEDGIEYNADYFVREQINVSSVVTISRIPHFRICIESSTSSLQTVHFTRFGALANTSDQQSQLLLPCTSASFVRKRCGRYTGTKKTNCQHVRMSFFLLLPIYYLVTANKVATPFVSWW